LINKPFVYIFVVFQVFEPDDDEVDVDNVINEEHRKIFLEYKDLVDTLLASHMTEMEITTEQLDQAFTEAKRWFSLKDQQVLFEMIWAANNLEIFKPMMINRNIDLQLQVLEILVQKFGSFPKSFLPCEDDPPPFNQQDRELVKEMIKTFTDSAENLDENAKADMANAAIHERARLEKERAKEQERMQEALKKLTSEESNQTDFQIDKSEKAKPVKKVEKSIQVKPRVNSADRVEVKERQLYLRKLRDKIIETKKKERKKQLAEIEEIQIAANRPKSAKAVRKTSDEGISEEDRDKGLAFRRTLAAKLKEEIVNK